MWSASLLHWRIVSYVLEERTPQGSIWPHRERELPFPSSPLTGLNPWGQEVNYHLLGCLEPPLILKVPSSCWFSEEKRPTQTIISLALYLCAWHPWTLIMRLMQNSMWREVLAEEFPNQSPTWWVIIGAKWASAKATAWTLLFTIVKITLPREKGCYTLKTSTLHGSFQPTRQSAATRLRGSRYGRSKLCKLWNVVSEKKEDEEHLLGQIEVPFSLYVETHT